MRNPLRHLGFLALAALAVALSLVPPVRAAAMLTSGYERPKDFAFVKKDGVYHLFYIRHNDLLPEYATEVDFGHAVSTDLYDWTQLPPVLGLDPGGWDNYHVWAPHILFADGMWWMFYTGVTEATGATKDLQRIGVAVSTDLMTWNRILTAPVWQTSAAPWAWWEPRNAAMACRDAFVMADPDAPGQYLMYYTASPASDTLSTLVGVARNTTGSLTEWRDEKPLWVTHRNWSYNTSTESPHLFEHGGRWYLMITTNSGQPLSFFVGSSPTGDPAQWTYRGRLRNMVGLDTESWFASEVLRDGIYDLFAYCTDTGIEIRRIVWGTGDNFTFGSAPFFHMVAMDWSRPTAREGDVLGLVLQNRNGWAYNRHLVAYVLDPEGVEVQAPIDSLGLQSVPTFLNDTTVVSWQARRWPATLSPAEPMRVRVAIDDGTASTPWLSVYWNPRETAARPPKGIGREPSETAPPYPLPVPPGVPEDTVAAPTKAVLAGAAGAPTFALRVLTHSPLASHRTLAFALAAPAEVRVDVFDLQGRRVVTLADRSFAAGAQVVEWDGREADGGRAPRGLYFVRATSAGQVASARVLIAR